MAADQGRYRNKVAIDCSLKGHSDSSFFLQFILVRICFIMPNTSNTALPLPRLMTISEACKHIGNNAMLNLVINLSSLLVPVKILDARQRWGRIDFQISPENGSGSVWVEANKIKVFS